MALKKWNTNFRLEHPDRKNRTTFSDVSLLSETDFVLMFVTNYYQSNVIALCCNFDS